MKSIRKTYPARTDNEFILLSFNELKLMMYDIAEFHKNSTSTYSLIGIIEQTIHNKLNSIGVKPTKKQLVREKQINKCNC